LEIISPLQNFTEFSKQSQSWREALKQEFWRLGWKCVNKANSIKFCFL